MTDLEARTKESFCEGFEDGWLAEIEARHDDPNDHSFPHARADRGELIARLKEGTLQWRAYHAELRDRIAALTESHEHLERKLDAYQSHEGDPWRWVGDGSDDLTSLACPILIHADQLRELLMAELEQAREQIHAQGRELVVAIESLRSACGVIDRRDRHGEEMEEKLEQARDRIAALEREKFWAEVTHYMLTDIRTPEPPQYGKIP